MLEGAGVQFGHRTAALHLNNAFSTIVGQLFSKNPNNWYFFSRKVKLAVNNRVAKLDVPLIQNATNSNGVISVSPTGASCKCFPDDTVFYPIPPYALNSSSDISTQSWFIGYAVTQEEVRFTRSLPSEVTELEADVVPQLQYYSDHDEIALPSSVAQMIIDSAVASMKGGKSGNDIYKKYPKSTDQE